MTHEDSIRSFGQNIEESDRNDLFFKDNALGGTSRRKPEHLKDNDLLNFISPNKNPSRIMNNLQSIPYFEKDLNLL